MLGVNALRRQWRCLPKKKKNKQKDNCHRWMRKLVGIRKAKERRELPPLEMIITQGWKESLSCVNILKKLGKSRVLREQKHHRRKKKSIDT